jgi:hypothetical protein
VSFSRIAYFDSTAYANATITVDLSGISAGDILVFSYFCGAEATFSSLTGGWTEVYNSGTKSGSQSLVIGVAYKIAAGGETQVQITSTSSSLAHGFVGQYRSTISASGDVTSAINQDNDTGAGTTLTQSTGTTGSQAKSVNLAVCTFGIDSYFSWDAGRVYTNSTEEHTYVSGAALAQSWFAHNSTSGASDTCDWTGDTADQAVGCILVFGETVASAGNFARILDGGELHPVIFGGII